MAKEEIYLAVPRKSSSISWRDECTFRRVNKKFYSGMLKSKQSANKKAVHNWAMQNFA